MAHESTEKFVRYAATVDTLPEVWAFVMDHVDEFGGRPSIEIQAIQEMFLAMPDNEWTARFSVKVYGTVDNTTLTG